MSFVQPPAFDPALLSPSIPRPPASQAIAVGFAQAAQLIERVGRGKKLRILNAELKVDHLQDSTADKPLEFSVGRANYDFKVVIWLNCVLIEVRINDELRGAMWPRTVEELQAALQTILNDTAKRQTAGQRAPLNMTSASWELPARRPSSWGGPHTIYHRSPYDYGY